MSSLEAKFEALVTKLNQQTPKEPTLGEIAYMQAQGEMMTNPSFQVEEDNYMNNRGYTFCPDNKLPSQCHLGLRNQENFSYGNKAIVPHEPHRLSTTMPPPGFQNQGALSSNYQGNTMQPSFHELLLEINDKNNDTQIAQIENNQITLGMSMKGSMTPLSWGSR